MSKNAKTSCASVVKPGNILRGLAEILQRILIGIQTAGKIPVPILNHALLSAEPPDRFLLRQDQGIPFLLQSTDRSSNSGKGKLSLSQFRLSLRQLLL